MRSSKVDLTSVPLCLRLFSPSPFPPASNRLCRPDLAPPSSDPKKAPGSSQSLAAAPSVRRIPPALLSQTRALRNREAKQLALHRTAREQRRQIPAWES